MDVSVVLPFFLFLFRQSPPTLRKDWRRQGKLPRRPRKVKTGQFVLQKEKRKYDVGRPNRQHLHRQHLNWKHLPFGLCERCHLSVCCQYWTTSKHYRSKQFGQLCFYSVGRKHNHRAKEVGKRYYLCSCHSLLFARCWGCGVLTMVQSRLIIAKNDIERELRRGVRNPQRKDYLTARLLQLDRDVARLGFSEDDIKRNNFGGAANTKTVGSDTYYVPPSSWGVK